MKYRVFARLAALVMIANVVLAYVAFTPVDARSDEEAGAAWQKDDESSAQLESLTEPATGEALKKRASAEGVCWTDAKIELKRTMKRLWIEHALWTGRYLVSALSELDNQKEVLNRLLRNQQDIGDAVKPYYGDEAGNQLAELLKEHILIADKVVAAAKAGNEADLQKFNKEWYRNADDIAKFLAAANPYWPEKELKAMLDMHLELLTDDVKAQLEKDWEGSIAAFDKGEEHLIHLADTLSEGIVRQFPDRFRAE